MIVAIFMGGLIPLIFFFENHWSKIGWRTRSRVCQHCRSMSYKQFLSRIQDLCSSQIPSQTHQHCHGQSQHLRRDADSIDPDPASKTPWIVSAQKEQPCRQPPEPCCHRNSWADGRWKRGEKTGFPRYRGRHVGQTWEVLKLSPSTRIPKRGIWLGAKLGCWIWLSYLNFFDGLPIIVTGFVPWSMVFGLWPSPDLEPLQCNVNRCLMMTHLGK